MSWQSHQYVRQDRRILFVDDVSRWHTVYKTALQEDLNCEVITASNGPDALKFLEDEASEVDLVLLDLNMPGMKGDDVLRRIRNQRTLDQIPVIIITGENASATHERLLEAGANDFVDKGSPYGVLLARVRAQLRQLDLMDQLTGIVLDLDMFAAGILHDMHNLEHGLIAYCYLMNKNINSLPESKTKDDLTADLKSLEEQLSRLGRYATDVIQTVRSSSQGTKLESISWDSVIDWSESTVNSALKGSNLPEIKVVRPPTWHQVQACENLLNLIALNLMQNSVKYARTDVPTIIKIEQAVETIANRPMVVTRFRDNGIGLKDEDLAKVFQPFVRSTSVSNQATKGFGLGLALVSKAVRSMHGLVWAEAAAVGDVGAVFAVALEPSE